MTPGKPGVYGWRHEVLFERCVRAERGKRYPVCLEGHGPAHPKTWAAPGYEEYLKAMADHGHERHEGFLGWRGPFNPEAFDPANAEVAKLKSLVRNIGEQRSQYVVTASQASRLAALPTSIYDATCGEI